MNRTYNNLIAIMIVVLTVSVILVITAGCSTHKYDIVGPDGGTVTVQSRLEFEQVEADYRRTNDGVQFRFRAGTATATPWLDDETLEAIKIISERLP